MSLGKKPRWIFASVSHGLRKVNSFSKRKMHKQLLANCMAKHDCTAGHPGMGCPALSVWLEAGQGNYPMIQKGPPAPALRLASPIIMDRSHDCWLRVVLAGSATKIFSSATPRSTMKWPLEVKCPLVIRATTNLPSDRASTIRCGSVAGQPSTGSPHFFAAAGINA